MDKDQLISTYPNIYHMAEPETWPSILEHGLLSTTALLDLYEVKGPERTSIEAAHRPNSVVIQNDKYGSATIRDQKPMFESALSKVLVDMSPEAWYRLLNGRVFCWATISRLYRFLSARAYRTAEKIVITIDTDKLVSDYDKCIRLSHINSGATLYKPVPRGIETFSLIDDFPFERWKRSPSTALDEITVDSHISNISAYALEVKIWSGNVPGKTIWQNR